MESPWFSACCRVVCLIEGVGAVDEVRAVHVFREPGWDEAFARALELGAGHEQDYTNAEGAAVRWRFAQVLTLDQVSVSDGAEVYSTSVAPPSSLSFDTTFDPKSIRPDPSGA